MNNLLTETYNIDTDIQYLQTCLYDGLTNVWNTDEIEAYGRVYRYEYDMRVTPHIYNALTKDYEATLYNDKSSFFFIDSTNHDTDDEHEFKANVKIVFMLNLDDVKNSSERVDSDVKRDVISILRNCGGGFKITGYESTIEEVFRGFDISKIIENRNDSHPLHVFAITGVLSYVINDKCN